jgi:hypothetical protein
MAHHINSHTPDIYEGVHLNTNNQVTLHTSPGCSPGVGPGGESGRRVGHSDCGAGGGFEGCGVADNRPSFGSSFNSNGGGVYASLWTSSGIKVWYFPSRDVPENIRGGNPNPDTWGTPVANFGGGCDYDARFRDMNIVSVYILYIFKLNLRGFRSSTLLSVETGLEVYGAQHPARKPIRAVVRMWPRSHSRLLM